MNKRNRFCRLTALLLAVALSVSTVSPTSAFFGSDPAVIYNGRTRSIEFRNAWPFGSNTRPDLFTNMKNMMPGDSVTQEITVGAENVGIDSVRIWLRAENPNEDYIRLIGTYGHWVTFRVTNGGQEITGDLAGGVLLGSFSSNTKTTIEVELAIDIEAGNELQNLVAEIDWVFTAEVVPGTTSLPAPDVDIEDLPALSRDHINYIVGYQDDTVRPEGNITRAEVATIFYRLLDDEVRAAIFSTQSVYPDVEEDDWFYVAVCTLTRGGILEGYPDGTFQPDDPITRAELATIICRFDEQFGKITPTAGFSDINGHWAQEEIMFAATRKYVVGYPDGLFRPDREITRAETVTMINRCLQRAVDEEGLVEDHLNWRDNRPGSWYYYEIIEAANYHSYTRSSRAVTDQSYCCEDWSALHELIDWPRIEKEWILVYTGEEESFRKK